MRWLVLLLLWLATPAQAQPVSGAVVGPTQQSAPINVATGTTQLIALRAGASIYITAIAFNSGAGADTVGFVYGTGTNCATGQNPLTGVMALGTNSTASMGSGGGIILIVPQGQAFCIVTTGATTGFVAWAQF